MKTTHQVERGSKKSPNFDNLRRTLLRQGPPGPIPFIELFADPGIIQAVLGERMSWNALYIARGESRPGEESREQEAMRAIDLVVRFCQEIGFDYVFTWTGLGFPRANFRVGDDTAEIENWLGGKRFWQDESKGPIQNWDDFEAYPWPKIDQIDYRAIEHLNGHLPDGMKISVNLGGIFENSSWLMGLESFSYALADQPDLVAAIVERVGEATIAAAAHAVTYDDVGMVFLGDDLGFATSTLVSPATLRKYIFPQHRRLVETVHAAGKLILLHCCGNLETVMDDLIDIGFDGKHSFEDKIMPVEEAYRRYGDRIAILGGVDMDLLGRGSEEQVRRRTREILEVCAQKGTGYCLGTGNSAANYIPIQNYLALLDEGRRWNEEHFGA